mmetsp:Transcript_32562/g.83257  ORF Transcript_32562/g.83257 Transcript_32562/m.83257 type:complete len:265 (-) Transcript_32562:118-912(-)
MGGRQRMRKGEAPDHRRTSHVQARDMRNVHAKEGGGARREQEACQGRQALVAGTAGDEAQVHPILDRGQPHRRRPCPPQPLRGGPGGRHGARDPLQRVGGARGGRHGDDRRAGQGDEHRGDHGQGHGRHVGRRHRLGGGRGEDGHAEAAARGLEACSDPGVQRGEAVPAQPRAPVPRHHLHPALHRGGRHDCPGGERAAAGGGGPLRRLDRAVDALGLWADRGDPPPRQHRPPPPRLLLPRAHLQGLPAVQGAPPRRREGARDE